MSTIHETVDSVLPAEPGAAEVKDAFTPSTVKIRLVRRQSRQEATAVLPMVPLKLLLRLGYSPMLVDVPPVIIDHIRIATRSRPSSQRRSRATTSPAPATVTRNYCAPGSTSGHLMPERRCG
uniref:hypothetical protein n=1 Tax=Burkholderia cepacia TaxID=292 RepID=UPI001FC8362B|nr:hypothetical protein [Burkholderia cepacia]